MEMWIAAASLNNQYKGNKFASTSTNGDIYFEGFYLVIWGSLKCKLENRYYTVLYKYAVIKNS